MDTHKIKENLYHVGVLDKEMKVFDVLMKSPYGTTYNAYLLKTEEGGILFDGAKKGFEEEYFRHIEEVMPLSEIKALIVSHCEMDHSGSISRLLELRPDLDVYASPSGINNLKNLLRRPFQGHPFLPGKELVFGSYHLKAVSGINLHWPDVIFTYIEELKTLITCDFLGAHYGSEDLYLSKVENKEDYQDAFRQYYDAIFSPFAPYVLQGVARVSELLPELILPSHGPLIDEVKEVLAQYENFASSSIRPVRKDKVTLVYASCYGFTKEMAHRIQDRLKEAGKTVSLYEMDVYSYPKEKEQILTDIQESDLVLFGSPTINNDAIPFFYDLLQARPVSFYFNKKASAFGDYGWSGEAVPNLISVMKTKKMKTIDGFKYSFRLDEAGYSALDTYIDGLLKA